jgi:hypothetical protein
MLGKADRFERVIRASACHNRHTAFCHLHTQLDHTVMLGMAQRWGFTRRANRHQCLCSGFYLPVTEGLKRFFIHARSIEWSDKRCDRSSKHDNILSFKIAIPAIFYGTRPWQVFSCHYGEGLIYSHERPYGKR